MRRMEKTLNDRKFGKFELAAVCINWRGCGSSFSLQLHSTLVDALCAWCVCPLCFCIVKFNNLILCSRSLFHVHNSQGSSHAITQYNATTPSILRASPADWKNVQSRTLSNQKQIRERTLQVGEWIFSVNFQTHDYYIYLTRTRPTRLKLEIYVFRTCTSLPVGRC